MANKILIMGESGTGKSTSIRNCPIETTAIVNPVGKALPFRGKYTTLNGEVDATKITKWMSEQVNAGKKVIIVDDVQYILAVPYMHRIQEKGWDKFNDFGDNYFRILEAADRLPADVTVAFLTHLETLESGLTTVKLIGKLLREKITIEGLFTVVLRTAVSEGKYYFITQNSGADTVKSPMGMFSSYSIDNDLNYVIENMRTYYGEDGAKTDEEMAKVSEGVAGDLEAPERKPITRRGRRTAKAPVTEEMPPKEEELPFDPDTTYNPEGDFLEDLTREPREIVPEGQPATTTTRRRRRSAKED